MSQHHKWLQSIGVDPAVISDQQSTQVIVRDEVVFNPPTDRDSSLIEAIRRLDEMSEKVEAVEPA